MSMYFYLKSQADGAHLNMYSEKGGEMLLPAGSVLDKYIHTETCRIQATWSTCFFTFV